MNEEYIVKKCPVCGAVIRVLKGKGDSITCCGELMVDCVPNTVDAAVEKHKPEVVVDGDKINVTVNHVMEDDHYIEWISISVPGKREKVIYLKLVKLLQHHSAIYLDQKFMLIVINMVFG